MTLHCAGRLGVLSWIYEQRELIAFELGLVDERPITLCGSGYLDDGLVIVQQDGASNARPSATFEGKDIELFFEVTVISFEALTSLIQQEFPLFDSNDTSQAYLKAIFHPPLVA